MKSTILFRAVLIVCTLFVGNALQAQEVQGQTYTITSNGTVADVQPYINALNNSDMKYHRLKNSRNSIVFESGVTVQLFSATEMNTAGRSLNLADYPESFDASRDMPVFSLGPNNIIMEQHHVNYKHN